MVDSSKFLRTPCWNGASMEIASTHEDGGISPKIKGMEPAGLAVLMAEQENTTGLEKLP